MSTPNWMVGYFLTGLTLTLAFLPACRGHTNQAPNPYILNDHCFDIRQEAHVLWRQGRKSEAKSKLQEARGCVEALQSQGVSGSDFAFALTPIGYSEADFGNYQQASKDLERSLKLRGPPTCFSTNECFGEGYYLAFIYEKMRKFREANNLIDSIIENFPPIHRTRDSYFLLQALHGRCYLALGQAQKAYPLSKTLIQEFAFSGNVALDAENLPWLYFLAGEAAASVDNTAEARTNYDTALRYLNQTFGSDLVEITPQVRRAADYFHRKGDLNRAGQMDRAVERLRKQAESKNDTALNADYYQMMLGIHKRTVSELERLYGEDEDLVRPLEGLLAAYDQLLDFYQAHNMPEELSRFQKEREEFQKKLDKLK